MTLVRRWLLCLLILLGLVVAVGGVTRLTGSGLSITEWKPIMGAIPPLSDAQWSEAFEKYKAIPQFETINSTMDLSGFKWIFFWEYLHRLLARLIGVAFALPFLFFIVTKRVPKKWIPTLVSLFVLGGLQGFLGWFMVKSGLSELTYVSHFRLAAHLILAFFIGAAILWVYKKIGDDSTPRVRPDHPYLRTLSWAVATLVLVQTFYGALTAGLKAGYQYNTFPTFHGEWFPADFLAGLSNPVSVQWFHRVTGTILVSCLLYYWVRYKKRLTHRLQRAALTMVTHLCATQYVIGISVVLMGVPVWLGAFHQVMGYLIFIFTANLVYEFKRT